ncbi:unnamed protein product [Brachionus calyciflorus]|uniref:Uncharacterized protein n=1 Tax=Brachionus calyciflorus TaxID=104777 RepID=A0A814DGP7_9BILA|nr:unnamed protein product [Brachionus calyciflorus]
MYKNRLKIYYHGGVPLNIIKDKPVEINDQTEPKNETDSESLSSLSNSTEVDENIVTVDPFKPQNTDSSSLSDDEKNMLRKKKSVCLKRRRKKICKLCSLGGL